MPSFQTPRRPETLRGTLGFIFTPDLQQVLLILKNRPDFAAGKYNGVGGKHEGDESDQACLTREVWEEAGISIPEENWLTVGHIEWSSWDGAVLTTVWHENANKVVSQTDEPVSWHSVNNLPTNCMTNLYWLIPLAKDVWLDKNKHDDPRGLYIKAVYTDEPTF
jgi:8-oxo-dGTP diphosphatase